MLIWLTLPLDIFNSKLRCSLRRGPHIHHCSESKEIIKAIKITLINTFIWQDCTEIENNRSDQAFSDFKSKRNTKEQAGRVEPDFNANHAGTLALFDISHRALNWHLVL